MIEIRDKITNELIETHPLPVGVSLVDWFTQEIDNFELRPVPLISVELNGQLLLQRHWGYIVQRNDSIVICPEPKNAGVMFVVKLLATAAVNYAVSSLISSKIEDNYGATTPEGSTIYNASAQANRPRLNGVIPFQLGYHKIYPDLISQPYTYYENNEQYLCMALCCGVGSYAVHSVSIGNTPIVSPVSGNDYYSNDGNFDYDSGDGNYWLMYHRPGVNVIPGLFSNEHPAKINYYTSAEVGGSSGGAGFDLKAKTAPGEWIGPFNATPPSEMTNRIKVDFLFPQGLAVINNDGSLASRSVTIELNWREVGTTTWNVVNFAYSQNTLDQQGITEEIVLGGSRPVARFAEVRVRRNTLESDDTSVRDLVQWTGLKSHLMTQGIYPDVSTLFVRIKGTNNLANSASNKINVNQCRRMNFWNGSYWTGVSPTRSAERAAYLVMTDSGLSFDQIDYASLALLRNYTFDGVFDGNSTLFESLIRIAAVAYCKPVIDNGRITFVSEHARSYLSQFFSADNMISITENGTLFDPSEPDGMEVEYFDKETWKAEKIDCLLNENGFVDAGIQKEQVRAFGIIEANKAQEYGLWLRRQRRYLRRTWELETELEGLNCKVGDLVSLPGRGVQHGWIVAVDDVTEHLTVNSPLTIVPGETYYIELRDIKGVSRLLSRCFVIDELTVRSEFQLNMSIMTDGSAERTLFKFGTYNQVHMPARVKSVDPQGDTVRLDLVAYDTRALPSV